MNRGQLSARALEELIGAWRSPGAPAYEALADRIRLLVLDGRISAEVRLPAERQLAARLGLSRTTATAAYRRLREAGFATAVQGSGTTTALPRSPLPPEATAPALLDLTKASLPATALLPAALREASVALPPHLAGEGYDSVGLPELRQAIADRYTVRGLPTSPQQILVTTGAQSAISLLARTLLARGDRAFAESPSYPHAYDALRGAGGRIVTAPVTVEHGWDVDALEAVFARTAPAVAYVMPDFHNPTGRSMTLAARERMLRAAAAVGTVVIADETPAELDIDHGAPAVPLAALAGPLGARVVQIGSASKLFWGGLRIGWVRADASLVARLALERAATDLGTPILEQLITARLIPQSEAIVAERRTQLAERRAVVVAELSRLLPEWTLPPVLDGGLAVWTNLGAPVSSQLVLAARTRGLLITAGPRFGVDGAFERFLRLPLTGGPDAIRQAVAVLADVWPQLTRFPVTELPLSTVA